MQAASLKIVLSHTGSMFSNVHDALVLDDDDSWFLVRRLLLMLYVRTENPATEDALRRNIARRFLETD